MEYIPGPHLAKSTRPAVEWEALLFQKLSRSCTELPMETYLSVIGKREYYGTTMFVAKVCA